MTEITLFHPTTIQSYTNLQLSVLVFSPAKYASPVRAANVSHQLSHPHISYMMNNARVFAPQERIRETPPA